MLRGLFVLVALCAPFDFAGMALINCDGSDLVVWGEHLHSNVGGARFSSLVSSMVSLPPYLKVIVVGLLLGDGTIRLVHSRSCERPNKIVDYNFSNPLLIWSIFGTFLLN